MAQYEATVSWTRGDSSFLDGQYSRRHELAFDGGARVAGSSSPHSVRVPFSDPAAVDPEEAFVASLSSCHMLWFLAIAAKRGFVVDRYTDQAFGVMGKNEHGRVAMLTVTLRPEVHFAAHAAPSAEELNALHDLAHHECYIANSVRSEVRCEPVLT